MSFDLIGKRGALDMDMFVGGGLTIISMDPEMPDDNVAIGAKPDFITTESKGKIFEVAPDGRGYIEVYDAPRVDYEEPDLGRVALVSAGPEDFMQFVQPDDNLSGTVPESHADRGAVPQPEQPPVPGSPVDSAGQ